MALPKAPCRDCSQRRLGCHDPEVCLAWAGYLAERERFYAAVSQERRRCDDVRGYVYCGMQRAKKRRGEA